MKRKIKYPMMSLWNESSNTFSHLSDIEEGEPCDPRPTVAEEIEILQLIEEKLKSTFDGKIDCRAWGYVKSALDSDIPEVKLIASRILSRMAEFQD